MLGQLAHLFFMAPSLHATAHSPPLFKYRSRTCALLHSLPPLDPLHHRPAPSPISQCLYARRALPSICLYWYLARSTPPLPSRISPWPHAHTCMYIGLSFTQIALTRIPSPYLSISHTHGIRVRKRRGAHTHSFPHTNARVHGGAHLYKKMSM